MQADKDYIGSGEKGQKQEALFTGRFYKSVHLGNYNIRSFWRDLVYSLTKPEEIPREELYKYRKPLRLCNEHLPYGHRINGVYEVGKDKLFDEKTKRLYSKHQSFTYTDSSKEEQPYAPPVFSFNSDTADHLLTGVILSADGQLIQRILTYDQGTFGRPYLFRTRKEAEADYAEQLASHKLFKTLDDLSKYGKGNKHNEVMVRARWQIDGSSHICIFKDTLEAKLMAQIRARDMQRRILARDGNESEAYEVPISTYFPEHKEREKISTFYEKTDQEKDIQKGRESKELLPTILSKFLLLEKENFKTHFEQYTVEEIIKFISLASDLTYETSELFFQNFILQNFKAIVNSLESSESMGKDASVIINIFRCVSEENREKWIEPLIQDSDTLKSYYLFDLLDNRCLTHDEKRIRKLLSDDDWTFDPTTLNARENIPVVTASKKQNEGDSFITMAIKNKQFYAISLFMQRNVEFTDKDFNQLSEVLMLAAEYSPGELRSLMEGINALDAEARAKILEQTHKDGFSALQLAAAYQPESLAPLMEGIKTLDAEARAKIFEQTDKDGWNALMFAARCQPVSIAPLMEGIKTLDAKKQTKILEQTDIDGWNALMFAALCHPESIAPLMEGVKILDAEVQAKILEQTQKDGCNALMLAEKKPQSIRPFLDGLMHLDESVQLNFLKKNSTFFSFYNCNVLERLFTKCSEAEPIIVLLAATHEPKLASYFLDQIQRSGNVRERLTKIFAQTDGKRRNILSISVDDSKLHKALLDMVDKYFDENEKHQILSEAQQKPEQKQVESPAPDKSMIKIKASSISTVDLLSRNPEPENIHPTRKSKFACGSFFNGSGASVSSFTSTTASPGSPRVKK